jgi:hypothetical protein
MKTELKTLRRTSRVSRPLFLEQLEDRRVLSGLGLGVVLDTTILNVHVAAGLGLGAVTSGSDHRIQIVSSTANTELDRLTDVGVSLGVTNTAVPARPAVDRNFGPSAVAAPVASTTGDATPPEAPEAPVGTPIQEVTAPILGLVKNVLNLATTVAAPAAVAASPAPTGDPSLALEFEVSVPLLSAAPTTATSPSTPVVVSSLAVDQSNSTTPIATTTDQSTNSQPTHPVEEPATPADPSPILPAGPRPTVFSIDSASASAAGNEGQANTPARSIAVDAAHFAAEDGLAAAAPVAAPSEFTTFLDAKPIAGNALAEAVRGRAVAKTVLAGVDGSAVPVEARDLHVAGAEMEASPAADDYREPAPVRSPSDEVYIGLAGRPFHNNIGLEERISLAEFCPIVMNGLDNVDDSLDHLRSLGDTNGYGSAALLTGMAACFVAAELASRRNGSAAAHVPTDAMLTMSII